MRVDKRTILIAGMGTSPAVLTETVWALCHQHKQVVPGEGIAGRAHRRAAGADEPGVLLMCTVILSVLSLRNGACSALRCVCVSLLLVYSLFAVGAEKSAEIDYGAMLPVIREKAIAGDIDAQFHYGWCLLNGKGVSVDEVEACKWLLRASDGGSDRACYLYGIMLATGAGVNKDLVAAQQFLSRAMKSEDREIRKLAREASAGVRDERCRDQKRKDAIKTFGVGFGIVVPLLLLGYYVLRRRGERLLAFSPGDYEDCFEDPVGAGQSMVRVDAFPVLPKWNGLPYRAGLPDEIIDTYQRFLGSKAFSSKLPPFARDMIYFLTGLDNTLKDWDAYPLLDLGVLPSALNERCLQRMAVMMANHIRMSCLNLAVVFDGVAGEEAGHIEWRGEEALIVIGREYVEMPYVALKVLAHELSHQYMRKIGVAHTGREENELLTDITSLYLGFGKYVFEGRGMENVGYYASGEVGYLKQRELGYVYDFICQLHGAKRDDVFIGLTKAGISAVRESRWNRFSVLPNHDVDKSALSNRADALLAKVSHAQKEQEFDDKYNELLVALAQMATGLLNEMERAPASADCALALLWEDDLHIAEACVEMMEK